MSAYVWLAIAAALLVAEMTSFTLVLCFFALGALAAAGAAALDADLLVQSLVALGVTLATLPTLRPLLRRQVHGSRVIADAPHLALIGTTALVVEDVTDHTGQVRIDGVLWRARAFAGLVGMRRGEEVSVAEVDGATLLVYPTELPWPGGGAGPIDTRPDSADRTPEEPPGSPIAAS